MLTQADLQFVDALRERLHNAGCFGERKAVKFALAHLTGRQRKLLLKLLNRSIKRLG